MKKGKVTKFTVAAIASLAIVSSGIFAWFVTSKSSNALDVSTGKIDACFTGFLKKGENYVPGESHLLDDKHPMNLINIGSRDMIVQFDIGNASKAHLKKGVVPPAEFEDDYVYNSNEGLYYYTPERLKKVATFDMIDFQQAFPWIEADGKYYAHVKVKESYYGGYGRINILKELGGSVKQSDGTLSPDRQFEQGTVFLVGSNLFGIQDTKAAALEFFDQSVVDKFPDTWFSS